MCIYHTTPHMCIYLIYIYTYCRGDGDCLFYSMIDVATEILRDHPPPGPSPEIDTLRGDDNLSKVGVTVCIYHNMCG